jgi:predicted nucleotidyltransferase
MGTKASRATNVRPAATMTRRGAPARTSMAAALFSRTQQRVLALLFGQPGRSFFAKEVIGLAGVGSGGVQRELARLEESGLVVVTRVGNQKHYQANPDSPVFKELCGLVAKTVGLAEPLREALATLGARVRLARVYGSVARGADGAASDIDLLVVAEGLQLEEVFAALAPVEARLGRPIHPVLYTPEEFERRRAEGNAFLTRVMAAESWTLIGEQGDGSGASG